MDVAFDGGVSRTGFCVTLILTFDLVCRKMSRTYLIIFEMESQVYCMDTSLDADVSHTIFRSL